MASSSPGAWSRDHSWRVPVEDLPWRRLPWIVPVALALWIFALWGFGRFMASAPPPPAETPPLDARIVELPPPEAPKPEPPVAQPQPAPPKVQAPPPRPVPTPPSVPLEPAPPAAAPDYPLPAAPPQPAAPAPTQPIANANQGRGGAYAIVKPDPKIPDELIDDAVKYRASIRFNIAVDGSATVELVKPTPNPRLNQIYLETYRNWKFFPATEDGKPVASSQTISPKVSAQ